MSGQREYRNGEPAVMGRWRKLVEAERAKHELNRELHSVVLVATDGVREHVEPEHHDWAYDLRRGRMRVYGSLLRCIDLLARRGVPKDVALMIPRWLEHYVHEVYGDTPTPQAEIAHEPSAISQRLRLYKPVVAKGASVIRKSA